MLTKSSPWLQNSHFLSLHVWLPMTQFSIPWFFQICFSFFTQSWQTLVKMSKIQRKISILSATSTPWVIMLRRLNFPLKNKKGRKGESLALLQNWHFILGYLLGLIDLDRYHSLMKGPWAWPFLSKSEHQRTSGAQKMSKSDSIYCSHHLQASSCNFCVTLGA